LTRQRFDVVGRGGSRDSEEVEIKKGMIFDALEHLKYFLLDYDVRFQRPYYVTHSNKKRYMVLYKNGCQWDLSFVGSEVEK
jgi:hypothetical protein